MKIEILQNQFLKEDGTFNKEEALKLSGQIAGICYSKEDFSKLQKEPYDKTKRRIDLTLNNGHHSVYDHITINFNIQNISKILAMVLNNEKQYTTSEKSARYTPVIKDNNIITETEENLYNKWLEIFKQKIKSLYGKIYSDSKIEKLAMENARYLITVFMPTNMIYSTTLRQINYIVSFMQDYIDNAKTDFEKKLANNMQDFIQELNNLNVLEEGLMTNDKYRKLSLFGQNLAQKKTYFGDVYSTLYKGSFAQLAQAHRHRTIDYQIELLDKKEFFIPPIIKDDDFLVENWLNDMYAVKEIIPQGQLVQISEMGKYNDFILKCKERLCTAAQLEIMNQTRETLLKYQKELQETNHYLASDIEKYTHGARCTFPDFDCSSDCKFKEGKKLTRKI